MTIKVLASGQSNMIGFATDNVPSFANVSTNVRVWNSVNPLGSNGTAFVTATAARTAGTFESTNTNNLAIWFADNLARRTFETVDLVMVARGTTSIANFQPGDVTVPMYSELTSVWAATGQGPADVFLWHQGERDVVLGTSASTYTSLFESMITSLITAGVLNSSTVILVGGLAEEAADKYTFNKSCLFQLTKKPRRGYAGSAGLTTFDGVHFDSKSLTALGARRYYSAYLFASGR